jgi:GT2 family glycosyltransferase
MRHGSRDEAEVIHHLNQRYRLEFDRAERLRAELAAIQGSRLWPWFCRLRRWGNTLIRRGTRVEIVPEQPSNWCQRFEPVAAMPLRPSQVSIVIPFRDRLELLKGCVALLRQTAADAEVILVDNGSVDPRMRMFLREWQAIGLGGLVRREEPFNFARLCNAGATEARREVLLFLNNDVTTAQPGWLEAMLAAAADPRVGVVGATLMYPDRTIQHAGLAPTGPGGAWEHPYRFQPETHAGDDEELLSVRSVPAVTGACLMIHRDLFYQVGGFDEQHAVTMNDIDLCQRVRRAGYEVVATPFARLVHFESLSRGYRREAA